MDELDAEILASMILSEGITTKRFAITLRHAGEITYVRCGGELDAEHVEHAEGAVAIGLDTQPERFHLDTAMVHRIDDLGCRCVARAREWCRDRNVGWLFTPGPIVADALEGAGLESLYLCSEDW